MTTDTLNVEVKQVYGSPVYFWNGKRLLKFPVERPLGKSIYVFSRTGEFIGQGSGSKCKQTGGCITIKGKKYDSNHELLWAYA